jgi:hypothetical protein
MPSAPATCPAPGPDHALLTATLDGVRIAALRDVVVAAARALGLAAEVCGDGSVTAAPQAALGGAGWDDPRWIALQQAVLAGPELAALRADPGLLAALSPLLGGEAEGGHGDIVRLTCPGQPELATRPHQDGFYLTEPREVWTVWIPLVPCPAELGPLALLRARPTRLLPHAVGPHAVPELADVPTPADAPEAWEAFPLAPPAALAFRHTVVHAALPNLTRDRLRLSVDLRFRPARENAA